MSKKPEVEENNQDNINQGRRQFLIAGTTAVAAVGAVGVALPFLQSWTPSARARAAGAPVKLDLSKLGAGQMAMVAWRGKPVYAVNRPQDVLDRLKHTDSLRDPESKESLQPEYIKGETRAIKPKYLILMGVCTHLGCAPKFRPELAPADLGAQWRGGFFCPCHGSKFDLSGRVYTGVPAPTNLTVPPHYYETDTVVIVGLDQGADS